MLSRYITLIEVFQALRNIVRASNVGANSFHVLRSYERYTKDGKTMGAKPADYDAGLFYDRNYDQTGQNIDEFEATYPRLIAEEILANSNGTTSSYDIQLTCLDLWHAEQDNSGADNDRNFKVIEEECYKTIVKAITQLQGFEKRMSADGSQIAFGHKSQFNTSPYNVWQIVDNMKRVIGSTPQLRMQRLADDLTAATAGSSVTFTVRLTLDPCGVSANYVTPCSGGSSSFELDVNGETVTVTSETYMLEVLQDGELIGTVTLGENSGTVEVPPCPTPDPVTVDVNGLEVEAEAGETMTVNITRNGVPIGDITVTGLNVDVDIPACDPCEDVTVSLNGDEVATVEAGEPLALTTTLNGTAHPATYTAGVINLNTPAPSGYRGIPLGSPSQLYKIRNGDVGHAFELAAFFDSNPSGFIGFQQLDPTDIAGTTLLFNNSLGSKLRFTDLSGNGNSFDLINWLGGDGVTYQAKAMIDHLYGVNGILIILPELTGVWNSTWQIRVNNATYNGNAIFSASRGILEQLIRLDTASNHLVSIMGHAGIVTSSEALTTSVSGSPIQSYTLNANLIGFANISTPATKTLLFRQL